MHFEFSHALPNWCQIKTNVTNLCNHLHLHADKNFSVKPLSVKWIASVLCSRYLLKIVQFMQVSFCDNLFRFKNKNVIHQPRSVHIGKNCAYCLVYRPRPQVLGHNFFQIRTDVGWWITRISFTFLLFIFKINKGANKESLLSVQWITLVEYIKLQEPYYILPQANSHGSAK